MTEEIIVTPWSCDSEWHSVRQDIYASKDTRNYEQALRKLSLWKARGRSLPRGLFCTELILEVITKDVYFCDVHNAINENDLVRLYSMAILKFVNLTADVMGKGPQKSMYFRASLLELPSWLIDMRHKISHDQDLPDLKSLRTAMECALEWLQTKYWNEDGNFLVVSPKLNMDIVDEFNDLLEFYMINKTKVDSVLKEERLQILKQKLSMPEFSHKECTKKFKELLTNKVWSLQLVNVFVARYLLQAKECSVTKGRISKTDIAIWGVLLKIVSSLGLLTNALQCLVTQNSQIAALWVIELSLVVHKSGQKTSAKHDRIDGSMNFSPLRLNTNLVLRTALNSTHPYTIVFLKWLLRVQLSSLSVKQQYKIFKLVSLYTGSVKIGSKVSEKNIYTVDGLLEKTENKQKSQWSLALGQMNWSQISLGTTL